MVSKPEGQSRALDCLLLGESAALSTHTVPFHRICNLPPAWARNTQKTPACHIRAWKGRGFLCEVIFREILCLTAHVEELFISQLFIILQ